MGYVVITRGWHTGKKSYSYVDSRDVAIDLASLLSGMVMCVGYMPSIRHVETWCKITELEVIFRVPGTYRQPERCIFKKIAYKSDGICVSLGCTPLISLRGR